MTRKSLLAALALTGGIAAIAAPSLLSADDRGGSWGDMMGSGMMGGMDDGAGPWAGFDFAKVDANGDGKITKEELAAWRQADIAGIDADGDNLISAEELTARMMAQAEARIEARSKARIEAQDANGDGKLSVEELIAPPMGTRLFDRADADGDGAVSEAEIAAMRERMQAMRSQRGGMMKGHGMMKDHGMMHGHGGWFDGMAPGSGTGNDDGGSTDGQ